MYAIVSMWEAAAAGGSFFTVSALSAVRKSEKNYLFLVYCHQTKWKQRQWQHRSVLKASDVMSVLNWGEQGWIQCTFRLQDLKCCMLPIDWKWKLNLALWEWSPFPQGYHGQRGCSEVQEGQRSWCWGLPSCSLCPLVLWLFKAEQKGAEAQLPSHGWYLLPSGSSESRAGPFAVYYYG